MYKILIIATTKISYNGISNHILSYMELMDKSDILVDILYTVENNNLDDKLLNRINNCHFNHIYKMPYRKKHPFKYYKNLKKLIKENQYDLVHAHGNSNTLGIDLSAAKKSGCKVRIAHCHNTKSNYKIINKLLKNRFNKSYNVAFACGNDAGKWLFKNKPFTIIPNGKIIDDYLFNNDLRIKYRKELNLKDDDIALSHVGTINNIKNQLFLIEIFKDLIKINNHYKLFLIGPKNEDYYNLILNEIKNNKLENNIFYLGTKSNINEYLNAFDLMTLPSLYEGLPIVLIEWQINGLPTIVSNNVTKEACFNDNLKYLPLEKELWVKEILNINLDRNKEDLKLRFSKAGYNLEDNVINLKKKYIELIENHK